MVDGAESAVAGAGAPEDEKRRDAAGKALAQIRAVRAGAHRVEAQVGQHVRDVLAALGAGLDADPFGKAVAGGVTGARFVGDRNFTVEIPGVRGVLADGSYLDIAEKIGSGRPFGKTAGGERGEGAEDRIAQRRSIAGRGLEADAALHEDAGLGAELRRAGDLGAARSEDVVARGGIETAHPAQVVGAAPLVLKMHAWAKPDADRLVHEAVALVDLHSGEVVARREHERVGQIAVVPDDAAARGTAHERVG